MKKYNLIDEAIQVIQESSRKGENMINLLSEILQCLLLIAFMIFGMGAMALTIVAKGG